MILLATYTSPKNWAKAHQNVTHKIKEYFLTKKNFYQKIIIKFEGNCLDLSKMLW
jgi:hypothetical protein